MILNLMFDDLRISAQFPGDRLDLGVTPESIDGPLTPEARDRCDEFGSEGVGFRRRKERRLSDEARPAGEEAVEQTSCGSKALSSFPGPNSHDDGRSVFVADVNGVDCSSEKGPGANLERSDE